LRRIVDIAEDLKEQLTEKLRNRRFSVIVVLVTWQLSCDMLKIRYSMKICFSAFLLKDEHQQKQLFKTADDFLNEESVKWSVCVEFAWMQFT
jgi:hypothetical protein